MTDPTPKTPDSRSQKARQVLKTPKAADVEPVAQKDRQQFKTPATAPTPDAQKERQQLKTPPTTPAPPADQGDRQQFTSRPPRVDPPGHTPPPTAPATPPANPAVADAATETPPPAVAFDESGGAVAEATGGPAGNGSSHFADVSDDVTDPLGDFADADPIPLVDILDDDTAIDPDDDGARADDHDGPLSDLTPGETPEPDGGYRPPAA